MEFIMKSTNLLITVIMLLASTAAMADVIRTGTVLMSEPLYETRAVSTPHEVCKTKQVPIYETQTVNGQDNTGSFLGGAVIGGIIGNAIKKDGAGAALGAILGGAIANESQKKKNTTTNQVVVGHRNEKSCKTHYNEVISQVISGYRTVVEVFELDRYRFDFISNKIYIPGEKLQVRVTAELYQG